MYLSLKFPILIAHREIGAQTVAGARLRHLQQEVERNGWKSIVVDNPADVRIQMSVQYDFVR
jgi:arginine decarboxylase